MKKIANMRVFPTILAGMIVGISFIILTDLWLPATVAVLALTAAVGFAVAAYKRNRTAFRSAAVFLICFASGAVFGFSAALYANNDIEKRAVFAENVSITAKIEVGNSSDLTGKIDGYTVILTDLVIDGKEVDGKAEFYSLQLKDGGYREGDVIEFVGTVRTLTTDITTPYKASALAEGKIFEITCQDDEDGGGIAVEGSSFDFFDRIKKAVASKLADNVPDGTARFMYAMLFGDSGVVEESLKGDFSYTGTAHLLAVSGLHVGMLAGALYLLLKQLRLNAIARSLTVIAILVFFCALCGFSPSTVRATIMVSVSMTAGLCGLRYDPLSGLSFSAIILLFVSPYNLYSLGFLMSFLAVYGLILFAKPLKYLMLKLKMPDWLAGALSATVAANITLLPVIVYVFGEVSLLFAPANCIIVPFVGIFFPLYLILLPLSFIPYLGFLATAASFPFTATVWLIKLLSEINFLTVTFNFSWVTIVLWLIAATAVSTIMTIPAVAKKIIASVLVICFVVSVIVQNFGMFSYENKVTCFSGYGGAGVLVQSKEEGTFIVISGEFDESTAQAASMAMKENKLKEVDFIVKFGLEQDESELMDEYSEAFGTNDLYTEYSSTTAYNIYNFAGLAAVCSVVYTYSYASVYLGGVDVLVSAESGISATGSAYDVIVCPYAEEVPEGTRYLVSEKAYIYGGKNCVPSDFTFWTDGDRIISTNKWRFA